MFDKDVLSQLSELKKNIAASKEYGEGSVVGSAGRYGFVKLDDSRDAFLNPEKMQHLLPGDRVKILITKNDKDQLEGTVEKLLEQGLKRFIGQYKTKGQNHFVDPEIQNFSRWLYLPPQARQKCEEDDWVLAELTKHPYEDGKSAAKVVARIGKPEDAFFEHKYIIAKHRLYRFWSKDVQSQVKSVTEEALKLDKRENLASTPFVTIDSQDTQDMDDAVFARKTDQGWELHVAIADPSSFISPASPLAKSARDYGQTVYLPGEILPMMPSQLSADTFSLHEDKSRPALVFQVQVASNGEIGEFEFRRAAIKSHKKLNYYAVNGHLCDTESLDCDEAIIESITQLGELAKARLEYRKTHNLVYPDQMEYSLILDEKGKIEAIRKRERNAAHRLIEEAMLITNICAGNFLAQHNSGVHNVHGGFRNERMGEVKALLKEEFNNDYPKDIESLEGFIALHRTLTANSGKNYLLSPLKRMMQGSEISRVPGIHCSQGFEHYAAITSPIRRYVDLSNHWTIGQVLDNKKPQSAAEKAVERLSETLNVGRIAKRELEQWLRAQYLQGMIGETAEGAIRVVTQQGFGVKLIDTGIEGFVQFSKDKISSFDAKRMTLTIGEQTYRLDQEIKIKVKSVDLKTYRASFEVAD